MNIKGATFTINEKSSTCNAAPVVEHHITRLSLTLTVLVTYEPRHEISNNIICATSKASDQPAHTRSLIRAFASRLDIILLLSY